MRLIECFDLLGAIIDLTQKKGQYLEEYKSLNLTCNILLETLRNIDNEEDFSSNLLLNLKTELLEAKILLETSEPVPNYNFRGVNHILPGSRLDRIKEKNVKLDRFSNLLTLSFLSLINQKIQKNVKKSKPLNSGKGKKKPPEQKKGSKEEFKLPKTPKKKPLKLFKNKKNLKGSKTKGESSDEDVKEISKESAIVYPAGQRTSFYWDGGSRSTFNRLIGDNLCSSIRTVASQIIECPAELKKQGAFPTPPVIGLKVCGEDYVLEKFKEKKEKVEFIINWPQNGDEAGDIQGCRRLYSVSRKNFLFLKYADMISREHVTIYGEYNQPNLSKEMFETCSQELSSFKNEGSKRCSNSLEKGLNEEDFRFFAISSSCNAPYLRKRTNNSQIKNKYSDELQTQEEELFRIHSQTSSGKNDDCGWIKMDKGEKYFLDDGDVIGIIMDWPDHRNLIFGFMFNVLKAE